MIRYTAPQHTPRKQRVLSHSTKILSIAIFLLLISLFAVVRPPAKAAANPIFATFQYVDNAISTALSPIHSAITSLQAQQASQAVQISDLQTSIGRQLRAYDANGQELGILINHQGASDMVYSLPINKFISLDELGGLDGRTGAYYQSSDCTGTPYEPNEASTHNANNVLPYNQQVFYVINISETPTTFTANSVSVWNDAANHAFCNPISQTLTDAYQLHTISLPFTTPIAEPLQFKYQ
jgi:hypothetical protein